MAQEIKISRPTPTDFALLLFVAMVWASSFSFIKIAVIEVGPIWTAAIRVLIGFTAVLPFAVFTRVQILRNPKIWAIICIVAFLNMVIPFTLISWGVQSVDAGIAALLMGTSPFVAIVMGHFFTRDEKINIYRLVAVFFGLLGILTIIGPQVFDSVGSGGVMSQLAIMLGATCYVISGLIMRKVDMKPIEFTTYALFVSAIAMLLIAVFFVGVPRSLPSENAIWSLVFLGAFPTGLAYVLRFYLVKRIGVGTFALGMNSIPVFGVIFGAMLLGEEITISTLVALALVISGLLVARLGTAKLQSRASDK